MSHAEEPPTEPAAAASNRPAQWRAFGWYRTFFLVAFFAALFCIPLMGIMYGAGPVVVVTMIFAPLVLLQWLLMRVLLRLIRTCHEPKSPAI